MGMFDTVCVNCPKCNEIVPIQVKPDRYRANNLDLYNTETAPPYILACVDKEACKCEKCDTKFYMTIKAIEVEAIPYDTPPQGVYEGIVSSSSDRLCKSGDTPWPEWVPMEKRT